MSGQRRPRLPFLLNPQWAGTGIIEPRRRVTQADRPSPVWQASQDARQEMLLRDQNHSARATANARSVSPCPQTDDNVFIYE